MVLPLPARRRLHRDRRPTRPRRSPSLTKAGDAGRCGRCRTPQGFNVGMNLGAAGGAGIAAHLHQHVVPRWIGDQNFIPIIGRHQDAAAAARDTRELLAEAWDARGSADRGRGTARLRVPGSRGSPGSDAPVRISMARLMVSSVVPRVRALQHRPQERQQRLADLPGRRVPEVRRAVVDARSSATWSPTVNIGSSNVVGRAHSKPMPSSHETSTIRLPRRNAARSSACEVDQRARRVLERAVDDDVVLGQERRERARGRAR